jgi:hypothetical protein
MLAHVPAVLRPAAQGLGGQQQQAGRGCQVVLHLLQALVQPRAGGQRVGQAHLQHQVHRAQFHLAALVQRAAPAVGVVAAHVAQQPGPGFHAVDEFLREQRQLGVAGHRLQRLQALSREGQLAQQAARLQRFFVARGHRHVASQRRAAAASVTASRNSAPWVAPSAGATMPAWNAERGRGSAGWRSSTG